MEGGSDIIIGKAEYQHPKRKQAKITSEKLDYFSELVIYLSILAIAHKPSIIKYFSIEDSLLFQRDDWHDFERSQICAVLKDLKIDDISILIEILINYLDQDNINNLRPFADIWRDLKKEPIIESFVCGNVDGIVYRGRETVISWQVQHASRVLMNSEEQPHDQHTYKMTFTEDTEISLVVKNGLHTLEQRKYIKVIDAPVIKFSLDKKILKKTFEGIEPATLNWTVSNASSAELKCDGETLSTDLSNANFVIKPKTDSNYELIVIGLDGHTAFKSEKGVIIREPAKVSFVSDKLFTLPGVPITLSWNVKKAKAVWLNDNRTEFKGQALFKPDKNESYVLKYEDDFGLSSTEITIRMLPLPVVKSILVDTPNINNALGIHYSSPQFHDVPSLPSVETKFADLSVPHIPSLEESGLFVSLPETPKIRLTKRISKFFRNIFK